MLLYLCFSNLVEELFIYKITIMKKKEKLVIVLNSLLADELTAINQYMVHSEMCG